MSALMLASAFDTTQRWVVLMVGILALFGALVKIGGQLSKATSGFRAHIEAIAENTAKTSELDATMQHVLDGLKTIVRRVDVLEQTVHGNTAEHRSRRGTGRPG